MLSGSGRLPQCGYATSSMGRMESLLLYPKERRWTRMYPTGVTFSGLLKLAASTLVLHVIPHIAFPSTTLVYRSGLSAMQGAGN